MEKCNDCGKTAVGRDHDGIALCAQHMIEAEEIDETQDERPRVTRREELAYQANAKTAEFNARRKQEGW